MYENNSEFIVTKNQMNSNAVLTASRSIININTDDYEGMIEWLKHNVQPQVKVKEYMKKTAIKRAAWIRENPGITVEAILKEHTRLFDTPGMVSVRQINHYIQ